MGIYAMNAHDVFPEEKKQQGVLFLKINLEMTPLTIELLFEELRRSFLSSYKNIGESV